MENITVGFALTGSFCTFAKVVPQIKAVVDAGYRVLPIMSEISYTTDTRFGKAKDFITTIETITKNSVIHTIKDSEPIGPKNLVDAMIVAPCTGNTAAKIANGITDSCVAMAAKASLRNQNPLILAISTNELVIIELSRENLVKSRVSVLSSYFISLRASTNSFKSQNISYGRMCRICRKQSQYAIRKAVSQRLPLL